MLKMYKEDFIDKGLITAMKEVDETKYNEIFGEEYDNEILDDFILFNIGDCFVTQETDDLIQSNHIDKLAKFAWLRFYNDWKVLLKSLETDIKKSYVENIERNTDRNGSENIQGTSSNNNKIFAYDSETASNDSMEDSTNDNETTTASNEKTTEIRSGYNYGGSLMDLIQKYTDYSIDNNFTDCVISDIAKLTTYSIV